MIRVYKKEKKITIKNGKQMKEFFTNVSGIGKIKLERWEEINFEMCFYQVKILFGHTVNKSQK
jgi:hypothetical protein